MNESIFDLMNIEIYASTYIYDLMNNKMYVMIYQQMNNEMMNEIIYMIQLIM